MKLFWIVRKIILHQCAFNQCKHLNAKYIHVHIDKVNVGIDNFKIIGSMAIETPFPDPITLELDLFYIYLLIQLSTASYMRTVIIVQFYWFQKPSFKFNSSL